MERFEPPNQEKKERFRKIEKLGEGAYGVVYRVFDSKLQKVTIILAY